MSSTSSYFDFFLDLFKNLQFEMTEEYVSSSTTMALIVGIIAAALIIVTAFLSRRNRVLGVIAGLSQIAGVYALQKSVHLYMDLELFQVFTGDSIDDMYEQIGKFYVDSISSMLPYMIYTYIFMGAWILALVFIIKNMKLSPKLVGTFSLILHIFRYLFVSPIPFISALSAPITEQVQKSTDLLNYGATLLPFALLIIVGIVSLVKKPAKD